MLQLNTQCVSNKTYCPPGLCKTAPTTVGDKRACYEVRLQPFPIHGCGSSCSGVSHNKDSHSRLTGRTLFCKESIPFRSLTKRLC